MVTCEKMQVLRVLFPARLFAEAKQMAQDCDLSTEAFISQAAEVTIAERRLAAQINPADSFVVREDLEVAEC